MYPALALVAYIDPNTSQQVFSLLAPLLAFLTALGGLLVGGLVFLRHRIALYFQTASWSKRIVTALAVAGTLALAFIAACRLAQ